MVKHIKPSSARFRQLGTDDPWIRAHVPGSVHTDLLAAGRIPDPFVADNELEVQWVAESDWEYLVQFDGDEGLGDEQHVMLVCDGLDTLADVTFNGRLLGHTDNMFRQYRWEVTEALRDGTNEVHVVFPSTVAYMLAKQAQEPLIGPSQSIPGGPHVRKAPCQFGWDWGPQLPPIGIWREMRLEGYTSARLEDVHVRQFHASDGVTLTVRVALERWEDRVLGALVRVTAPDGQIEEARLSFTATATEGETRLTIETPELWWPNGLGGQPLYRVEVLLYAGERALDRRAFDIGLRKLELRREKDAYGESFTFVVNDVPVFAKGANWIPADSFPTQITAAHQEHLIRSAAAANMNMLRVWGGGLYEDDHFYALCDRYGLLIWQDFIFSCSTYPGDAAFVENCRVEAIQNIQRLRHHPCLALWCGNNEMEGGWIGWGWSQRMAPEYRTYYDQMFHHLLPALCAQYDPDRAYWPSSPSSGTPFEDPGGVQAGDTHNWEVWHGGRPFEHYRTHPSRFVSEFGFQSLPTLATIRTYAEEKDWNMTSYIMEHHQRNGAGNGKIINYMTAHFRLPKDFPALVYLTQLLQAEAVRTGVEFWRRNRACTSGALYWQLNDCWPVASWASLDYFGRWKALHYMARRFFAPQLLTAEARDHREGTQPPAQDGYLFQPKSGPFVDLFVVNDEPGAWDGRVRWSLETLDGEVLSAGTENVHIDGVSASRVAALDFEGLVSMRNARSTVLVYELLQGDTRKSLDILTFAPSKHLDLRDPGLEVQVSDTGDGYAIEVKAARLARYVWLELDGGDVDNGMLSDNYFDLPAERSVTVKLPAMTGWDAERIRSSLRVRSLVDSL